MANGDPNDFSFLSPEERLFVLKQRLPRLHNYLTAIIVAIEHLLAMQKYDLEITDPTAQLAANSITEMVANTLIIEVAGIWESFDGAGFSIPTLLSAVDHPAVLKSIEDSYDPQERSDDPFVIASHPRSTFEPSNALQRQLVLLKKMEKDARLTKVRNYRNKYGAHPVLATKEERSRRAAVDHPTIDEVHGLVDEASVAVLALSASVYGQAYDYGHIGAVAREQSRRLFAGLVYSQERMEDAGEPSPEPLAIAGGS